MMNVSKITKKGRIASFEVTGADVKLLNAFRRIIISSIPVFAVEKINFLNNTSILNDEILAHRIGLIPLSMVKGKYIPYSECKCEGQGCKKCTVKLTIDVTGPKTVYSSDMISEDELVKPTEDTIPIVKLMPNQYLKIEAEAVISTGVDHIKWQSGLCGYEEIGKGKYNVFVESYGPYPVEQLIEEAFEAIDHRIVDAKKQLK